MRKFIGLLICVLVIVSCSSGESVRLTDYVGDIEELREKFRKQRKEEALLAKELEAKELVLKRLSEAKAKVRVEVEGGVEKGEADKDLSDKQVADKRQADKQLADKDLSDKQVADKRQADKQLADKQQADKQLADKQVADKQLADKDLSDKQVADKRQADKQLADKRQVDKKEGGVGSILGGLEDRGGIYSRGMYKLPLFKDSMSFLDGGSDELAGDGGDSVYYNPKGYFIEIPEVFELTKGAGDELIHLFYEGVSSSQSIELLIGIGGISEGEDLGTLLLGLKVRYNELYSVEWVDDVVVGGGDDLVLKGAKELLSVEGESRSSSYYNIYYIYLLKDIRDNVCFIVGILSFPSGVEEELVIFEKERFFKLYSSFSFF